MGREEDILKSLELKSGEYFPPDGSKSARFIVQDDFNNKLFGFLVGRFGIENKEHFRKKFDQAISGDGDEAKKMISVRSSSLCALLCFYNVEEKPITFKTENGQKIRFNKSFFEVKNKVYNNPSNMDVVLISEDNEYILFIESKFAEYLENGAVKISRTYRDEEPSKAIYDKALGKIFAEKTANKYKVIDKYQYMGGLKQIISHYVGLQNYKNRQGGYMSSYYTDNDSRLDVYKLAKRKILFTEIVFKLAGFEDAYNKYNSGSKELFKLLKEADHDVEYLNPTDYKALFTSEDNKNCLNEEIKKYYKLNQ